MPPGGFRRRLANPRTQRRAALFAGGVAGGMAAVTRATTDAVAAGSVAFGWSQLGYVAALAIGVVATVMETRAALAFADFALAGVRRRALALVAAGLLLVLLGCIVGEALTSGGPGGPLAVGVTAGGLCAIAGGGGALLLTQGADYAGRKIDERLNDDW